MILREQLTTLGYGGCKDFLEEENKSNVEADLYYINTEGYKKQVNASYSTLRDMYAELGVFSTCTDIFVKGYLFSIIELLVKQYKSCSITRL